LWLLIRGEHLAPEALICPATTDVTSDFQKAENFWDFGSTRFLSYGLQSPYGYGGSLSVLTPSGVILVADGSPYVQTETGFDPGKIKPPAQLKIVDWGSGMDGDQKMFWGNSPNHDGKGQNVGYFGGQAEWRTGANCGKNGDNIYTATNKDGSNEDTATSSAGVLSSGVRNNEFDTLILP
jgi:hypothetical protein